MALPARPRPRQTAQESQEESSSADSGDSADSSSPESDGGVVSQGQGDVFCSFFLCLPVFVHLFGARLGHLCGIHLRTSDPRFTSK